MGAENNEIEVPKKSAETGGHQKNDLLPTREMCSSVFLDELKPICSRAGIPIKADKKCIDMTVELLESFLKLKQVPKSRSDKKKIDFQGIQKSLFASL
jgi:hypothetical protein